MDYSTLTPRFTAHFHKTLDSKGFDPRKVRDTLKNPVEVYASGSHPGQWRLTGNGVCIVGKPEGEFFTCITLYADRVVTPCRPDQLNTPEGRKFAREGRKA